MVKKICELYECQEKAERGRLGKCHREEQREQKVCKDVEVKNEQLEGLRKRGGEADGR